MSDSGVGWGFNWGNNWDGWTVDEAKALKKKLAKAKKAAVPWRDPLIGVTPGKALRIVRKRRNMSVAKLAKKAGLTPVEIEHMETKNRIGRLRCMAVAKALRISPTVIMFPDFKHDDD